MSPKNDISPFLSSADQRWLKYGKAAPKIIAVLKYRLDLNLINQNNIFDGRVWTHITQKELAGIIQHPITTMQRSLQRLKHDGFILDLKQDEGSLNNVTYYSLSNSKYQIISTEYQNISTEETDILLEEIKLAFLQRQLLSWGN